jgi:hypothetical protein
LDDRSIFKKEGLMNQGKLFEIFHINK